MARVYLDCNIFSQAWFSGVLRELIENRNVTFTYCEGTKINAELSRVRQALTFYKAIGAQKTASGKSRRVDAPPSEVEKHELILRAVPKYISCRHCDDAHIFALVYVKPTKYIFSTDNRMAKCRGVLNQTIDKRYCDFIVLTDDSIYRTHKVSILG